MKDDDAPEEDAESENSQPAESDASASKGENARHREENETARCTVGEAFDGFLRDREDHPEGTVETNEKHLNQFVDWCNEELKIDFIDELDGRDLQAYKLQRRANGDASTYINNQLNSIKVFLRFCEDTEKVPEGLASKVRRETVTKDDRARDEAPDKEVVDQVIDYLRENRFGSRVHVELLIFRYTSCRLGGELALDLKDIDFENNVIRIRHRPDTDTGLKNKTSGERDVTVPQEVMDAIEEYVKENREDVEDDFGREPLLTTQHGRPADSTIRRDVYKVTRPCEYGDECPRGFDPDECEAAKSAHASKCPESWYPHALRRESLTYHLREGMSYETLGARADVSKGVLQQHYDVRGEDEFRLQRLEDVVSVWRNDDQISDDRLAPEAGEAGTDEGVPGRGTVSSGPVRVLDNTDYVLGLMMVGYMVAQLL